MRRSIQLVLLAACYLLTGCEGAEFRTSLKDYDEEDVKYISVQEIQAPRGVRCFVLIGSREKLGQTLSCFPSGGEAGASR